MCLLCQRHEEHLYHYLHYYLLTYVTRAALSRLS